MANSEGDAEALAFALMAGYPDRALEVAVRLRGDALTSGDVERAGFWDDVLTVISANNP